MNKQIRSLAWVAVRWASQIRPRVMILENVREFADWGPLTPQWVCDCGWKGSEGQAKLQRTKRRCPRCDSKQLKQTDAMMPDPEKKGMTFRLFVNRLRGFGYCVEWRNMNAADYGAPTHRRRLFLIARRDGKPIIWPEPTHGHPDNIDDQPLFEPLRKWRTAAECIDWSIPCPSIFERKRPLKEATMRRIAMGIKRYVLEAEQPFIVRCNHGGDHFRGQSADQPMCTMTSSRDAHGLVMPILSKYHGQKANESRCKKVDEPFNTLDTQPRYGLVAANLIQTDTVSVMANRLGQSILKSRWELLSLGAARSHLLPHSLRSTLEEWLESKPIRPFRQQLCAARRIRLLRRIS